MAKTPTGKNNSGRGQRDLTVKVKSARGRRMSSTLWLQRQLNDPYVKRAKAEGYRGRAAFKIMELDDKYRFLVPGARVVDLGCAPGGWCQVAVPRINALGDRSGKAVAFDVLAKGGTFVAKVLAGGAEGDLQKLLKQNFSKVAHMKPPSSRSDSSEKFVVATGFKGRSHDEI